MKSVRKVFFWVHLSVGCLAGLVIMAMSVTGAVLAFERPIKAHIDAPAVLQGQADASQRLPIDTVLATLKNNGQGVPTELIVHSQATAPTGPLKLSVNRQKEQTTSSALLSTFIARLVSVCKAPLGAA